MNEKQSISKHKFQINSVHEEKSISDNSSVVPYVCLPSAKRQLSCVLSCPFLSFSSQ